MTLNNHFHILLMGQTKALDDHQPVFAPAAAAACSMSDGPVSQVGAGTEPQPHGASDQDLVPEQEDEVQEELAAADGE